MSDQTDMLTRTLTRLGLTPAEVSIYLYLLANGTKSALEVSRGIRMARTRVYRLLDKLEASGLITQKFGDLGLKFTASPHRQLELLLTQRQSDLDGLKASLPLIFGQLGALERQTEEGSHIYYHHGIDGLKHVTWNSLRAEGELRIYEVSATMTAFLPQEFSEKVREEFGARKTKIFQLTNLTHIKPYTEMLENVKYWTPRHIDPKELSIKTEIMLYNDMTVLYHYLNRDIFCIEIENADLVRMQTQLFDFIWSHARSMKKIGDHGEAVIATRVTK